jgi:hypothetical protein
MSLSADGPKFFTAKTKSGLLIIHSSPLTLSWVPRDVVDHAYNVGGTLTVGTFESVDDAKRAACEQYSVPVDTWRASDVFPLDSGARIKTENHTPEIDGHSFVRHGIRWK